MHIVFRVDASRQIGLGHVMRCIALADGLRQQGAACRFVCREWPDHAGELIQAHGHALHWLPLPAVSVAPAADERGYAAWLGVSLNEDAEQTLAAMGGPTDWLILDHYALDARWEWQIRSHTARLLVIDDLADRPHLADLLLDQNLGRRAADYARWVPQTSRLLIGPEFALLRPQFHTARPDSLLRRDLLLSQPQQEQQHAVLAMGGVDPQNFTGRVLTALAQAPLPGKFSLTVILGQQAPWLEAVRAQAAQMPWPTEVLAGVENMEAVLAQADWAIGAAGGSAWERCALGVPTLLLLLAENQRPGMNALVAAGAGLDLGSLADLAPRLVTLLSRLDGDAWMQLSLRARQVCDGGGVARVLAAMQATSSGQTSVDSQ